MHINPKSKDASHLHGRVGHTEVCKHWIILANNNTWVTIRRSCNVGFYRTSNFAETLSLICSNWKGNFVAGGLGCIGFASLHKISKFDCEILSTGGDLELWCKFQALIPNCCQLKQSCLPDSETEKIQYDVIFKWWLTHVSCSVFLLLSLPPYSLP